MRRDVCVLSSALTVACLIVPLGSFANVAERREQVFEVLDRRADAGLRRDVAAIDRVYSDDYFHTNPDGSLMDKAAVLASYRAPTEFKFTASSRSEERLQLNGDSAVVSELITLKGMRSTDAFTSRYRVTSVLRRIRGQWKIVNSHASLLGITPGA